MRDLPLSKRPESAILDSQSPGIGGMSAKSEGQVPGELPSLRTLRFARRRKENQDPALRVDYKGMFEHGLTKI
jgi:hypothetical protein